MTKLWLARLSCDLPPLVSPDNGVTILNVSLEQRQTWPCARLAGMTRSRPHPLMHHLPSQHRWPQRTPRANAFNLQRDAVVMNKVTPGQMCQDQHRRAHRRTDVMMSWVSSRSSCHSSRTNHGWKLTFLLLSQNKLQITWNLCATSAQPNSNYNTSFMLNNKISKQSCSVSNCLHDKWGWGLSAANLSDSPEGRNGRDFGCGGSASLHVWPCYWTVCPDELCGMSSHQRWSCHPWWRARHNASETLLRD